MEIKRRELNKQLDACKGDIKQMKLAYHAMKVEMEQLKQRYFKEVQRGTETEAFLKWNEFVIKELHIDNVTLFGLNEE